MENLNQSFAKFNSSVQKAQTQYSGLIGLPINGNKAVQVDGRNGYIYVRLRDSLSEVLQVYNDKVSPVYGLPIIITRLGNRWIVVGKDTQRYENWGTNYPFLPAHADQHSFNRDGGGGGDTVFIYPDQFMPLLVYPSGTFGASNLLIAPYVLKRTADFLYVGNTGTGNLLIYKPTDNQAIMGLVYLDKNTGNPGLLIASGTPLAGTITGTSQVIPYLPYPSSTQEPLYAFRLVSGSTAITWSNLYNVRQFIGGSSSTVSTGSSGVSVHNDLTGIQGGATGSYFHLTEGERNRLYTGTSIPYGFSTGSIPFANSDGTLTESNLNLRYETLLRSMRMGANSSLFNVADLYPLAIVGKVLNSSPRLGILGYGTGTSGRPNPSYDGYRSRGTVISPTPVQSGDALVNLSGNGFDGSAWQIGAQLRVFADQNWITGTYYPTRFGFEVIPSGTSTLTEVMSLSGDGLNLSNTGTYNVNGIPHTHSGITRVSITPVTTTNITSVVNTEYFCDVSGMTADRDFILPTGTVGDIIKVNITTGDDLYELIYKGTTGVSINGGSTATEWSREFITGEYVEFRLTTSTNWQVTTDGRIPCKAVFERITTSVTVNSALTDTKADWNSLPLNIGNMGSLTDDRANIRRAGYYECRGAYAAAAAIVDLKSFSIVIWKNGTGGSRVQIASARQSASGSSSIAGISVSPKTVLYEVGDYLEYYFRTEDENMGLLQTDYTGAGSDRLQAITFFEVLEVLR